MKRVTVFSPDGNDELSFYQSTCTVLEIPFEGVNSRFADPLQDVPIERLEQLRNERILEGGTTEPKWLDAVIAARKEESEKR